MPKNPDRQALRRYDRWLDDEINAAEAKIQARRRRGQEIMITQERRSVLRECRDVLQGIHREEMNQ